MSTTINRTERTVPLDIHGKHVATFTETSVDSSRNVRYIWACTCGARTSATMIDALDSDLAWAQGALDDAHLSAVISARKAGA